MFAPLALAIHGGAGALKSGDHDRTRRHLTEVAARGKAMLVEGAAALDVVVALAAELEESGLYLAGRGSAPNREGVYELDAAVMEGASRRAGAVAALQGYVSPVKVARAVMERTPHVLLAGAGAAAFAAEGGFERLTQSPEAYYGSSARQNLGADAQHGTVGVVARDRDGRLAAATSTGGTVDKMPGRVGDTPLIGAGAWADGQAAVSCTGKGEAFIRAAAAVDVAARMRYGGQVLGEAARAAVDTAKAFDGTGGLIAVDADGNVAAPYSTRGMRRAWVDADGAPRAAVFDDD